MGQTNSAHSNNADVKDSQSVLYREKKTGTLPGKATNSRDGATTRKVVDLQILSGDRVRPVTMTGAILNFNAENELKNLEVVSKPTGQTSSAIENGYHKTDFCYYRTPQGNFHKLPIDSYHKMSEGCYIRLADGNFRRLHVLDKVNASKKLLGTTFNHNTLTVDSNSNESSIAINNSRNIVVACEKIHATLPTQQQQHQLQLQLQQSQPPPTKMKHQMLKFLKRSKSHTPATIKQLQNYNKEFSYIDRKLNSKFTPNDALTSMPPLKEIGNISSANNKVVVTMMENGGLPIVATSKADKFKKQESDNSTKSKIKKVVTELVFTMFRPFHLGNSLTKPQVILMA